MRKTLMLCLAVCLTASAANAETIAPPERRPIEQPAQYVWDLICLAADNHWKINGGVELTPADEADSLKLMKTAEKSAAANGKDFQAMADDMNPHFMAYLYDSRAYFGMTSGEMRIYCLKVLDQ